MIKFANKSLLFKLVLSYFILSAITVVIIAVTTNRLAREGITEGIFSRLTVATNLKEYQLNYWIDTQKQDLFLISQFQDIKDQVLILNKSEKSSPEYQKAYQKLNNYLIKIQVTKPQMEQLSILSPGGFVLVSTNNNDVGKYLPLGNLATYFNKSDNFYVTPNFYTSRETGKPKMTFATPIENAKGNRVAVLAIDLNLDGVDEIIRANTGLGKTGETYLVGKLEDKNSLISGTELNNKPLLGAEINSEGIEAVLEGKNDEGLYNNYADVPIIGVYTWIDKQNLGLLAEITQAEAFAPVNRLSKNILLLGLSSVALLLVAVYLLSRRITQPILAIANTAINVIKGNLSAKAPVLSDDEIGLMAQAFNQMTQQLQTYFRRLQGKNIKLEKAQADLAEYNLSLEKKVEQRTKQIQKTLEQLKTAKAEAEAANRTKSTFLANMSHELRTPLNAIIGYSEMLIEEAEDQEIVEFVDDLDKIHRSGKHLLSLINDILDLSKVEAGRMELYLENFEVKQMIKDVTTTIEPLVQKNNNTLRLNCPQDIGIIYADSTRIRQSLLNLLSNACKFTENGSVTLDVKRYLEDNKEWISLTVSDTGIGISQEQINKLFQPFSQADASTTRKYGGTGLGLVISRKFCQLMGGDILVESQVGVGSSFIIKLPCVSADPKRISIEFDPQNSQKVSRSQNQILVIDDDPASQDLVKRLLVKEGFQVTVCDNGEDGLKLVKELHPLAVVLDVMMPNIDGWSVLNQIKSDPEIAHIPVIMASMVNEQHLGYALGANEYLTKPLDRQKLKTVLDKYNLQSQSQLALIVDDDPNNRNLMGNILIKEGWSVLEADNGVTALEILQNNQPDLILLDLIMPEMDGFEFIEHISKQTQWQTIPVICITAEELAEAEKMRLNGSVKQIIQKCYQEKESFSQTIQRIISKENFNSLNQIQG